MSRIKSAISKDPQQPQQSFFDRPVFGLFLGVATLVALCVVVYLVDFNPNLSHLNIRILSGTKTGNYFSVTTRLQAIAKEKGGKIQNIPSNGSIDNIKRLRADTKNGAFALVQNGLPYDRDFELVTRLTESETVFFVSPNADRINSFSDIQNMRIGTGPVGSGAAHLANNLFKDSHLKALNVKISNHATDELPGLLKSRNIDLALFVISESSAFIEKAIRDEGMQIASFRQCEGVAKRLPFLRASRVREGFYDPVRNLPSQDKNVLKVDTLVLSNGNAKRSQIVGLLSVLNKLYPDLVSFNQAAPNNTGLTEASAARDYYSNQGPEIFDRYAPRLIDLIPLGNLVQITMVVSILFNLMGLGNRFILWRIDANRLNLEGETRDFFGTILLIEEVENLTPKSEHRTEAARAQLDSIIDRFQNLETHCRKRSTSILVPMGTEMSYRYQEQIISRNLVPLRVYREKMAAH